MGEFENMYIDEVVFEENGKITSIPTFAFQGNKYLKTVDLGNKVSTIGVSSFADCTELTKFIAPLSVKNIESGAFSGCTSLDEVYLYNPDVIIEGYVDGNLTHLQNSLIAGSKQYKKNVFDVCGTDSIEINLYVPYDRGDKQFNNSGFKDGAWYAFIPASWLVDKTTATNLVHEIDVTGGTISGTSTSSSTQYPLFKELYPATYMRQTLAYNADTSAINTINFNTDGYDYVVVSSNVSGSTRVLDVLVTPSNDTIPEYTDIYAYRYTKPSWTTEGYVPDDDINLYSETSPMEYIDTYTRSGALYPLDEVISIKGTVGYPKQLKGVSYDKFGITVSGTRRDNKKLNIVGYNNDYDETDLTLGDRDVNLEYECPVSLVSGKPTDKVVVNLNDERKVTIQGTLRYSNSNPIANKTIRLVKSDLASYGVASLFNLVRSGTPLMYETVTSETGEFKFDDVAVGEYNLQLYNDVYKNELLASVDIYVQDIYDNDDTKQDGMDVSNEADGVSTTLDITDDLFNVDAIMEIKDPDEDTTEGTTEEDTTESTTTEDETTEGTTEEETTETTTTEDEPDDKPDTGDKSEPDLAWLLLSICLILGVAMIVVEKFCKDKEEL